MSSTNNETPHYAFFPFCSYFLPLRPNKSDSNLIFRTRRCRITCNGGNKVNVGPNLLVSSHWDRPGSSPQLHTMSAAALYRLDSIQNAFTDTNLSSTSPNEYKCIILCDNSRYCFTHTLSMIFQFAVSRDPHTFKYIVLQLILCVDS